VGFRVWVGGRGYLAARVRENEWLEKGVFKVFDRMGWVGVCTILSLGKLFYS